MPIAALAVSFGAFASALVGGWLAMRAVRYVGVIIAAGAGILVAGSSVFQASDPARAADPDPAGPRPGSG